MVSYFIPRGRFIVKAGHLRQFHQKQQQQEKWTLLRQFRRSLLSNKNSNSTTNVNNVDASKEARVSKTDKANLRHQDFPKTNNISNEETTDVHYGIYSQDHRKGWQRWTGFLLRWAPIGICFFGAIEWQLHKRKCQQNQLPRTASDFQSRIYRSLPLRLISRCWGFVAACYIPVSLRPYIYGMYSRVFNVNIDEALYPDYKYYQSLAEFFTRPLRDGVRLINHEAPLVSPADGRVLHFGSASNSLIEQVKGVNYNIESFLGPPTWVSDMKDKSEIDYAELIKKKHDGTTALYQCVIYLAPGDYHRFHSPTQWQANLRRHFSGELLSVSPKVAMWLPGLFCLNERAVYLGNWQHGFFSYTAVGATNVGSVQIYMDEELKTNRWVGLHVGTHKRIEEYDEMTLKEPINLGKGELLGQFNMGSTIVLLFEAPTNFRFNIEAGQKIHVGESLGFLSTE